MKVTIHMVVDTVVHTPDGYTYEYPEWVDITLDSERCYRNAANTGTVHEHHGDEHEYLDLEATVWDDGRITVDGYVSWPDDEDVTIPAWASLPPTPCKEDSSMKFINLTPHELNVHTGDGVRTFPPSGTVSRVPSYDRECRTIDGIPTVISDYGEVTDLPAPQEGVVLIVSGMVASHAPRRDVVSPGPLVRDDKGKPCGCRGLRRSLITVADLPE